MIQGINGRRKSAVQTEYTSRHDGRHWQKVKGIGEVFPNIGISVLSKALIVKSVDLGNLARFVISPQNGYAISVPNFERYQECDSF